MQAPWKCQSPDQHQSKRQKRVSKPDTTGATSAPRRHNPERFPVKMNANLLFRSPIRKLAGAVAIAASLAANSGLVTATRADEPEFVRIEVWQGLQKLDKSEVQGF